MFPVRTLLYAPALSVQEPLQFPTRRKAVEFVNVCIKDDYMLTYQVPGIP